MAGKLRTGIVAFGLAGRSMHYQALVEGCSDLSEVVAVWNRSEFPRPGRNEGDFPLAEEVSVYNDIDAFFAHDMDIVHITSPSGLHMDDVVRAAKRGIHVICDKPLDVTLERIDTAIRACRTAGVTLTVNFQSRFSPHLAKLKSIIEEGALGEIIAGSVECKLYRAKEYYTESAWHGRYDLDGGAALMNQSIHYIDLLQWLMGSPVIEVRRGFTERLVHSYIEAEDFGYGELTLASGANMTILGGTCFRPGIGQRLDIRGTDGWVTVQDGNIENAVWGGMDRSGEFGEKNTISGMTSSPTVGTGNHIRFFRHTYEAVLNGDPVSIDGHEGRKAVEIIMGIYKASQTGDTVTFPVDVTYRPTGIHSK